MVTSGCSASPATSFIDGGRSTNDPGCVLHRRRKSPSASAPQAPPRTADVTVGRSAHVRVGRARVKRAQDGVRSFDPYAARPHQNAGAGRRRASRRDVGAPAHDRAPRESAIRGSKRRQAPFIGNRASARGAHASRGLDRRRPAGGRRLAVRGVSSRARLSSGKSVKPHATREPPTLPAEGRRTGRSKTGALHNPSLTGGLTPDTCDTCSSYRRQHR